MRFLRFFTTNIGAKFLALIFAASLWIYVVGIGQKIGTFPAKIPIEVKNLPANTAIAQDLGEVELKIRAPLPSWNKLKADNFSAYVDLNNKTPGVYEFAIEVKSNNSEVDIIDKKPSKIIINLEPVISKIVPVMVKIEGDTDSGFIVSETKTQPLEAEIKGAKSLVEQTLEASAPINLSGEAASFEKIVELTSFDSEGNAVKKLEFNPKTVKVSVKIEKASNIKVVGIKVNLKGEPKEGFWVSKIVLNPATVTVSGNTEVLKKVDYLETSKIDISNISKNTSYNATLSIPSDISLIDKNNKVKVTIYLSSVIGSKEIVASFNFLGGKSGFSLDKVTVTVSGPANSLNALTSKDVMINVDLSAKSKGDHLITLSKNIISVPGGFEVITFNPQSITVTVY